MVNVTKKFDNMLQLQTITFFNETCILDGTVSYVMHIIYYLCLKDTIPLKCQ